MSGARPSHLSLSLALSLPGLLHCWLHCKTFLLHPLKWLLFHSHPIFFFLNGVLCRSCSWLQWYTFLHAEAQTPRTALVSQPCPPRHPPLSPSACAISWHSRQGGCCGFLLYLFTALFFFSSSTCFFFCTSVSAGHRLLLPQLVSKRSIVLQPGHGLLLRLPGGLRGKKLLPP